jgi:hypothetical protein
MGSPIKVYYDDKLLSPGPTVSINKEFIYANDTVIGYNYVFNLQGYASSVSTKNGNTDSNLKNTVQSLEDIQTVLNKNGKIFRLHCPDSGLNILRAFGGHLRSFEVQETDNKWVQYAKYSAQIEFTRVLFAENIGATIGIDQDTAHSEYSSYLVKLKTFSDTWTFSTSEESLYKYYTGLDDITSTYITEDYSQIQVEYTVSATGKHYYFEDVQTKQAWEVAKDFVQLKLYDQILLFRNSSPLGYYNFPTTTYNSNEVGNLPPLNQSHSYFTGVKTHPILSSLLGASYRIFNEVINCSSSESDGTFSATYSCILQYVSATDANLIEGAIHSFDVSYEKTRAFESNTMSINVNGTITGLLRTNILVDIIDGQVLILPKNGPFLVLRQDRGNKYFNALQSFNNQIADITHSDLKDSFKSRLDINYKTLFPETNEPTECVPELKLKLGVPKSFNVTHNYSEGSVSYTAEYDNERACSVERGFETLTVTEEDPVPIIAEFVVPGRENGPVMQSLNSFTHKKVSFEFSGTTKKGCTTGTPWSPGFTGVICDTDQYVSVPQKVNNLIQSTEAACVCDQTPLIPTSKTINYNPVDGSYSLSRSYIVCPYNPDAPGC